MKKVFIFSVLSIALALGVFNFYGHSSKPKLMSAHAKMSENFNTLDEMEQEVPLIVIGKKLNEKPVFKNDEEGTPIYFYSLSDFEIEKVIKNSTGKEIEANKDITILETAALDKEKNEISTVNGYQLMKENKRYILFLNPNRSEGEEFSNVFNIAGVVYGKYSFENDKAQRDKIENEESSAIDAGIQEKRKKMYQELNKKFNK